MQSQKDMFKTFKDAFKKKDVKEETLDELEQKNLYELLIKVER